MPLSGRFVAAVSCSAAVVVWGFPAFVQAGRNESPAWEIAFRDSTKVLENAAFHVRERTFVRPPRLGGRETLVQDFEYDIVRAGPRWHIDFRAKNWNWDTRTNQLTASQHRQELLCLPDQQLFITFETPADPAKQSALPATNSDELRINGVVHNPGPVVGNVVTDAYTIVFGFLGGYGRGRLLDQVLRESTVSTQTAPGADGRELLVVNATGPWGAITLGFDARDHLLVQGSTRKTGKDWVGDDKKSIDQLPPAAASWMDAGGRLQASERRFRTTEFQTVNGKRVWKRLEMTREKQRARGRAVERNEVEFSKVRLGVSDDEKGVFALHAPIQNGTRFSALNEPTIQYEWRDGKVIKPIDPTAVGALEGFDFRRGGATALVSSAALTALVVGGIWILIWKKARRATS